MGVKLVIARRQSGQEFGDVIRVHAGVLQKAEDGAGVADGFLRENTGRARAESKR